MDAWPKRTQASAAAFGRDPAYTVVPRWVFTAAGLLSGPARAIRELLPRYAQDNLFDSTRFQQRFPDFAVTRYAQGLQAIHEGAQGRPSAAD